MIVALDEMKNYLRVDFEDDDNLISDLILSAERICSDVSRIDLSSLFTFEYAKTAVMYTVAYLYENREKADHNELMLTLRSLLSGGRQEAF